MLIRKLEYLLVVFILCSCSIKQGNEKNCSSRSAIILYSVNNYDLKERIIYKLGDTNSELINELFQLSNEINVIVDDLIEQSGGIDPSTGFLIEPCKTGPIAKEMFRKSDIKNRVKSSISSLKSKYTSGRKQRFLNEIEYFLSNNFYGENAIFKKEYLTTTSYADICLDLLIVQNVLYISVIADYHNLTNNEHNEKI